MPRWPARPCQCSAAAPVGAQFPTALAETLLQRVLPGVQRLRLTLGSFDHQAQLLRLLQPLQSLRSLALGAADAQRDAGQSGMFNIHP